MALPQRPLRGLVGTLPLKEAERLVLHELHARQGTRTRFEKPAFAMKHAPQRQGLEQARQTWMEQIEKPNGGQSLEETVVSSAGRLLDLLRQHGQRPPTFMEMGAALAFHHGLESNALLPAIMKMRAMEHRHKKRSASSAAMPWTGTSDNLAKAVKLGLPAAIEPIFHQNKSIMHADDIARELGIPKYAPSNGENGKPKYNPKWRAINDAMQLLEQMNLVRKEIPVSQEAGGSGALSTWAHSEHGDLPVGHKSAQLYILKGLWENNGEPLAITRFHKPVKGYGNPQAMLGSNAAYEAAAFLLDNGLLETAKKESLAKRTRGGKESKFKVYSNLLSLTPLGRELMEEFHSNGGKSFERLRKMLLVRVSDFSANPKPNKLRKRKPKPLPALQQREREPLQKS